MRALAPVLLLAACYQPPELPLLDDVPVAGPSFVPCANDRDAEVGCVLQGDRFDVAGCGEGAEHVGLLGIVAPDPGTDTGATPACYAAEATEELTTTLTRRRVTLSFDTVCEDPEGGTLAYAWLVGEELDHLRDEDELEDHLDQRAADDAIADALLVNEWLVARGFATVKPSEHFGTPAEQARLERAQDGAIARGLGLWSACVTASP